MKKTPKNANKFSCENCDFNCSKESDWNRHITTAKHINKINGIEKTPKTPKLHICDCGKEYKYSRGLWTHKKKCYYKPEETKEEKEIKEDIDYKLLLLKMMEQNKELQNTIITFYNYYKNP